MFNQQEVQILVGGINAPIDIEDLQQNCNYGGLYDENHETIRLFWKVSISKWQNVIILILIIIIIVFLSGVILL